ncbi:hypothetical protein BGZ49_010369 [Haplosporangium sp. Z 27]|nr:hypothetical protein BGZ49_010369 [Haplosporangium sp. Z 27]
MEAIRIILDDDTSTALSPLHQLDIHLVAHAMKWAVRNAEDTIVTYEDYLSLYVNQDRNFSSFVRDLPPTNRAILLDLFSLCADVTLLAHLNDMTLVIVAKSMSLSIMDDPQRETHTFDASFQDRNLRAAACDDMLRAFLRIKTTHDLVKIDQEDEVDENRYICNETRVLKSARQRNKEFFSPSHLDTSSPSSASSNQPDSFGWSTSARPMSVSSPRSYNSEYNTPVSPLSHAGGMYGASLSRSQSIAKSSAPVSRAMSPSPYNADEITEYEELMQDQSHLNRLRQDRDSFHRPESIRRRSVADMESLYMLSLESAAPEDNYGGYDSDPEVVHALEEGATSQSLIPDFADGLCWDINNNKIQTDLGESPSLVNSQAPGSKNDMNRSNSTKSKKGVDRSNSTRSNASGLNGPSYIASPRSIRDLSKHQLAAIRLQQLQSQRKTEFRSLQRALSQQDFPGRDQFYSAPLPQVPISSMTSLGRASSNLAAKTSPSPSAPRRSRRNSAPRRSLTTDLNAIFDRTYSRLDTIHADLRARELSMQADKYLVTEEVQAELLRLPNDHQEPSRASSEFSLQMSPQDLERPLSHRPPPTSAPSEYPSSSLSSPTLRKQFSSAKIGNTPKSFEVVSRPKDIGVNVIFTPISATIGASSPTSDAKSKFQESFPERPVSPTPKRTLTGVSTKGAKSLASTSSSPQQQQQQGNSSGTGRITPPILSQSASVSGTSTPTSNPPSSEGKPKSGFMRALSSKLRPKQSDDQLKTLKTNNQAAEAPLVAPTVSFEPPRLELDFLGDSLTPSSLSPNSENGPQLPPTSAPALMYQAGSGAKTFENWRRDAQLSLPITIDHRMAGLGQQDPQPGRYTIRRRSSTTMIDLNSNPLREQQRQITKKGSSPALTGLFTSSKNNNVIGSRPTESTNYSRESSEASILETDASEKEYRFSTATLMKDGRLHYQLQWEEFSNLGFKSDFATAPEQSGIQKQQYNKQMGTSTSSSRDPSLEFPGQLGQARTSTTQYQGPSPAQRAAAMKVARESFVALANDPQALEALKTRSVNGDSRPTIISSGSFTKGSSQPKLDTLPQITSKSMPPQQKVPYPSPNASLRSAQSMEMMSAEAEGYDSLQRSMSATSSQSSENEAVQFSNFNTTKQLGSVASGGGGFGSSTSLSSAHQLNKAKTSDIKLKGASRFFGKKSKALKKNGNAGTLPSNGRKRRMFPVGVRRQDIMTKTVEPVDEVFPWMCIEHMAGQESGWVMLEPVQDGAVGWVMIDKLEEGPRTRPQQQHHETLREQLQVA